MTSAHADRWLDWLLRGRDAGDADIRRRSHEFLRPIYDRILDEADLRDGDTVLEVGAGEGALGLLALERVGPPGRLILTDISEPVVEHVRTQLPRALHDRVTILATPVETLAGLPDGSVDAVLCRSVLIYSPDPGAALTSIARVLTPGGRLSLFEPLWRFHHRPPDAADFSGHDLDAPAADVAAVTAAYPAPPAGPEGLTAPALLAAAEAAGFTRTRAVVEAASEALTAGDDASVRRALHGRPNPNAPSAAEAARATLPPDRAEAFLRALEDAVRAGRGRARSAAVYLTAVKDA